MQQIFAGAMSGPPPRDAWGIGRGGMGEPGFAASMPGGGSESPAISPNDAALGGGSTWLPGGFSQTPANLALHSFDASVQDQIKLLRDAVVRHKSIINRTQLPPEGGLGPEPTP